MTEYIPRSTRQYIEGAIWIDHVVDYLWEVGLYTEDEEALAISIAKKLLYFNKDEGGELMEVDAREYVRYYIREVLEE